LYDLVHHPQGDGMISAREAAHTIIESVIIFFKKGYYLVATVIMAVNLLIPIAKFLIVRFLALSIHYRWNLSTHARLALYELDEFVGHSSTIEVFVVAPLASLIRLRAIISPNVKGIEFKLTSAETGSIWVGAPLLHKGFKVGKVEDLSLSEDGNTITITAFVDEPYDTLIKTGSRFWNA
jgi:hypothetical protein